MKSAALVTLLALGGCRSRLDALESVAYARNARRAQERAADPTRTVVLDPQTGRAVAEAGVLEDGGAGGVNDGPQRTWYPDGTLESDRSYSQGEPVGVWTTYWRTGLLQSSYHFDKSRPTPMTWWHANGIVASHGMARNGQRTGHWIYRYEHGAMRSEGSYANGRRHGEWIEYDPDGDWRERGTYRMGERMGDWEFNPRADNRRRY